MKYRFLKIIVLFLVSLTAAALLSACGSATKESGGSPQNQDDALTGGVHAIGVTNCFNCHADAKNPASFSVVFGDSNVVDTTATSDAEGWINGPHGNNESINGSHQKVYNEGMNTGFPDYGYFSDDTCQTCHDPLGEGRTIAKFFTETGIDKLGMIDRPVIGCEACHGGGGNHYGLGDLPFGKPDSGRCGQCHNSTFSHQQYHPEGGRIIEDYRASKHAASINSHNYASGSTTDVRSSCARCHTDEGAKLYLPYSSGTMTYDQYKAAMSGKPDIQDASVVQCRTCHDAHNPFKLLGEADADAPGAWSAQFKTCTACHQLLRADNSRNDESYHTPYSAASTTVNAYGSMEEIIPDTHFDVSTTPTVSTKTDEFVSKTGGIEGYVVDPTATHDPMPGNSNRGACLDCHNPHNAANTINNQWAHSAHGGHILEKKEAASNAYSAAVEDADAPGWIHYNWKDSARAACQRCHTSTGFRNFANDQAAYDANGDTTPDVANNYSHLTGGQAELLYCWSCHTDNIGGMRDPGQIVANYNVFLSNQLAATVTYTYPDISKSNVCMGCHTGRENGDSIALLNTQPSTTTANFSNLSFINSHYLAAGGTVFTATGYAFGGRDYSSPTSYRHEEIGTASAANTGSGGPCAGCHMSGAESHLFLPVAKNETTGAITSVTATVCTQCHGSSMTPSVLEARKASLTDALEALLRQLDLRGYHFKNAHPYFYRGRYKTGTVSVANGSTTVTGTGTSWTTAGIVTGPTNTDTFKVNLDGGYYSVAAVVDNTTLTLSKPYEGPTVTGASYAIVRSGSAAAVKDWRTSGDIDNTGATTGKSNMGAAFNFNLLEHDPGAYAHNQTYAKRLIYDAIDWLDNNALDYSTGTTLNAIDATDHPYKAHAIAYLLAGGTATGTSAERP
jgi:hypothetical protein